MEAKQLRLDALYIDIASRISHMSYGRRAKVGALLVKDDTIISHGWNGTPTGDDNNCEIENEDGTLTTKSEVIHAELNALTKVAKNGGMGVLGSTLYITLSPCIECAKLIKQAGISRVVYRDVYRDNSGINFLESRNVEVFHFSQKD